MSMRASKTYRWVPPKYGFQARRAKAHSCCKLWAFTHVLPSPKCLSGRKSSFGEKYSTPSIAAESNGWRTLCTGAKVHGQRSSSLRNQSKEALGMPVYEAAREEEVLRKATTGNHGPLSNEAFQHIFETIMREMRMIQQVYLDQRQGKQ